MSQMNGYDTVTGRCTWGARPPQAHPSSGRQERSRLAVPLAAELGYALLTKDRIKGTLHAAFGAPPADLACSRSLGTGAMELLWALAAGTPAVVIEANFRLYSEYERVNTTVTGDVNAVATQVRVCRQAY
jgi:hypothetical protein